MPDKILPTRTDAIAVRPESLPTPEGKTERREFRTVNSKTFLHPEKAADGKEIRTCHATLGAVCYRDDDGQLRSIDTTIRDLDGEVGVDWAPYKFRLHSEGIGFDFFSRDGGWVGITLSGIGGDKFDQDTPLKPDIVDNTITFRDVRPGCDIVFKCLNQRVKTLRILHDESAPREFVWRFWSDKPELIDNTLTGTDAAGNQLELVATVDGDTITETWTGTATTRRVGTPVDVVYPVEIDPTVNSNPAVSGDDGMETGGAWYGNGNEITFGDYGGFPNHIGCRFPNITIPQGTTLDSATWAVHCNTAYGTGGVGTAYGRKTANPAAFDDSNRPSGVTKTTATTAIAAMTAGDKSYNVLTILQELINQVSFASGNAVALMMIAGGSGNNASDIATLDSGSNISSLSITYTAAAGGTAGKPLMLLGCG